MASTPLFAPRGVLHLAVELPEQRAQIQRIVEVTREEVECDDLRLQILAARLQVSLQHLVEYAPTHRGICLLALAQQLRVEPQYVSLSWRSVLSFLVQPHRFRLRLLVVVGYDSKRDWNSQRTD